MGRLPKTRIVGVPFLLAAWLFSPTPATSGVPAATLFPTVDVHEILLDNGFRILVVEDHRVARVAASFWYRFGAMQEPNGEHGAAHFLEHVIFQGTTTVGTKNFDAEYPILHEILETEQELLELRDRERNRLRERNVFYDPLEWPTTPELEALRKRLYELEDQDSEHREFWAEWLWYERYGGTKNHGDPVPATTGYERIEIDIDMPQENIELIFRLEADRMVNAVLRGWEAQRYTVLEQLLNYHSRPEADFYFALDGVRGWGHLRDFAFFNRASMLRMYERYGVPNNTTLVLVGDITPERARALGEQYFGRIPAGDPAPARMELEAEPIPRGAVRLDWAEPLEPRVIVRYRIPGVGHPDRPIVDVIEELLNGRHGMVGSRLASLGEREGLDVTDQLVHTYQLGSPGALQVVVRAREDGALASIEQNILEAVRDLRRGRIDDQTLERARKALQMEWDRIRSDRRLLAYELGTFNVMDSWKTLQPYMETRLGTTVEDVERVAAKYFVPANRTIGVSRQTPLTDPR